MAAFFDGFGKTGKSDAFLIQELRHLLISF
jgi:hypothetical protein